MIVWLASYPRSGNTLTRTMLNRTFGMETYSEYNDRYDLGSRNDVSASVGHKSFAGSWDDFYQRIAADETMHVVKTHGPPRDTHPAIYVVRDARSAIVSQFHYFERRHLNPARYSLRQLSEGASFGGDWSRHLDAWRPLHRPRTLFLRYEEIVEQPGRITALLAAFLGKPPRTPWRNPFESQRALLPSFFRGASDAANLAEWKPQDLHYVWSRHERWMRTLGYGTRFTSAEERRPLWRPRSQIVFVDQWQGNTLKLGPESLPGIVTDGFFSFELYRGQPCRWAGARLFLAAPVPPDRLPSILEFELWAFGPPDQTITIRANNTVIFDGCHSELMALKKVSLAGVPRLQGRLEVEIVAAPFRPPTDPRSLGVCVRHMAIIAATE
ncbi:sulfotransferase domain-containing protein [Azospirillum sp. sgz301742]